MREEHPDVAAAGSWVPWRDARLAAGLVSAGATGSGTLSDAVSRPDAVRSKLNAKSRFLAYQ